VSTPTLWFTGLSASGKSTLAQALCQRLRRQGRPAQVIDGDQLRQTYPSPLGYSRADRRTNVLRAAAMCRACNDRGVLAIAALISPYRQDRAAARELVGADAYQEIYVSTPLAVCEQRDPKGLYRKARAGAIQNFTGISDPYEPPRAPALELATQTMELNACIQQLEELVSVVCAQ
jgi:adenylylsulfate kinase